MQENEENLAIYTVILMAGFGTKNVHSAMLDGRAQVVEWLSFIVINYQASKLSGENKKNSRTSFQIHWMRTSNKN